MVIDRGRGLKHLTTVALEQKNMHFKSFNINQGGDCRVGKMFSRGGSLHFAVFGCFLENNINSIFEVAAVRLYILQTLLLLWFAIAAFISS